MRVLPLDRPLTVRVVAEAGQCMGGSPQTAVMMAKEAKLARAWGFKTQLLEPSKIARADAALYWDDKLGNQNQREAFTRAGLIDYAEWAEVKGWCEDMGLAFGASPFDLRAVKVLDEIGADFIKIASGDIDYQQLVEAVAATGKPVVLSCGASYEWEIEQALGWLGGSQVTLLACTLSYPTAAHAAHLARISTLRALYPQCEVGYSDHTSLPETALAAAALGATMLEVHYTLNNDAPDVPDHAMAVNPERLAAYVEAANLGAELRGNPELEVAPEELAARVGARRSLCAARDLPANYRITAEDLIALRPGDAVPPYKLSSVVGRLTDRAYREGQAI